MSLFPFVLAGNELVTFNFYLVKIMGQIQSHVRIFVYGVNVPVFSLHPVLQIGGN